MARSFQELTRRAIRALAPGHKITEGGITAEKLSDGDIRYIVNIMVDGQRIHRVIGLASDDTTRTQAEDFISGTRADANPLRLNGMSLSRSIFSMETASVSQFPTIFRN